MKVANEESAVNRDLLNHFKKMTANALTKNSRSVLKPPKKLDDTLVKTKSILSRSIALGRSVANILLEENQDEDEDIVDYILLNDFITQSKSSNKTEIL